MPVQDQLAHVKEVFSSDYAFAALLSNGSVVTCGDREWGGDSSIVQDELRNVRTIARTTGSFAAIREDGCVLTCGKGDSSGVRDQLGSGVREVVGSFGKFAAILAGGSVLEWGNPFPEASPPSGTAFSRCPTQTEKRSEKFTTLMKHSLHCWQTDQ